MICLLVSLWCGGYMVITIRSPRLLIAGLLPLTPQPLVRFCSPLIAYAGSERPLSSASAISLMPHHQRNTNQLCQMAEDGFKPPTSVLGKAIKPVRHTALFHLSYSALSASCGYLVCRGRTPPIWEINGPSRTRTYNLGFRKALRYPIAP